MKHAALFLVLLTAACHSTDDPGSSSPTQTRSTAPPVALSEDAAIFPAALGDQVRWLGYTEAADHWTPPVERVVALDARLAELLRGAAADPGAVNEYAAGRPDACAWIAGEIDLVLDRLGDYRRQYVGVVDDEGSKRILVRGFAGPAMGGAFSFPNWREELAIVSDGGFWYWYAVYDPEEARFVHFRSNGYA